MSYKHLLYFSYSRSYKYSLHFSYTPCRINTRFILATHYVVKVDSFAGAAKTSPSLRRATRALVTTTKELVICHAAVASYAIQTGGIVGDTSIRKSWW